MFPLAGSQRSKEVYLWRKNEKIKSYRDCIGHQFGRALCFGVWADNERPGAKS